MKKLLVLFFLIVFCVFGAKKELVEIRQEISNVKKTADSAITIVTNTENLLSQIQAAQKEIVKKQNIIDVLLKDFSATRLEDVEVQLIYLTEAFRDLYSQVKDIRLIPFVQQAQKTAPRPSGFTVSTATETLGGDEYSLYSRGLDAFRKNFFDETRQFMKEILNSFPKGKYSDRAYYWIAESYFAQKSYSQALEYYQKIFSFKGSAKEDDAQYRIGICYYLLGESDKSLEEFTKFIQKYPASEFISKANETMKKISTEKNQAAVQKNVKEQVQKPKNDDSPKADMENKTEEPIEIIPESAEEVQDAVGTKATQNTNKKAKDKTQKEGKAKPK
ncbi:MAG: tetratricopeptide repeat protein [Chitinispirillales bacterium]|jgi:TolA-binding protein|nr:tetratricopeptide repeat protein [Chitinispirillales bacterium]